MGSMKLVSPELIIYTTVYMSIPLASENLFMVGSLNTSVTVCITAAQERKINQSVNASKCFKIHLSKKDRFLSFSSFFPSVSNSSWI